VANGYLTSLKEIVHGELFGDFLNMADYLVQEGYKDAAAIIGGGVLESHLRQLCIKHGIGLEYATDSGTRPKLGGQLNADLAREKVYKNLDQQNVTAWLALRNNAAHDKFEEYTKAQVSLMLQGVRDFISRYPA